MKIPTCPCSTEENTASYSEKYDAYFCSKCSSWLEKKCSDSYCVFCTQRPEKYSDET